MLTNADNYDRYSSDATRCGIPQREFRLFIVRVLAWTDSFTMSARLFWALRRYLKNSDSTIRKPI